MSTKPEPFDELEAAMKGPQSEEAAQEAPNPAVAPAAASDDATTTPAPQDAGEEIWEKKAQEYLAGWKRAQADYQNLRKNVEQEKTEIIKYANRGLLEDLLPLMDHFNMAFKAIPEAEKKSSWLKGVEYIGNNFKKILAENGVSVIPTVGEKFNPEQHESVGEVASDLPEGVIAEEAHTGFMLHGKVVQPAKVKLSTGKSN